MICIKNEVKAPSGEVHQTVGCIMFCKGNFEYVSFYDDYAHIDVLIKHRRYILCKIIEKFNSLLLFQKMGSCE